MSSSNRVKLAYIKEVNYKIDPGGDLTEVAYISESLNGSPNTVESQRISTDRQPQGQIVVGLSAGGEINFELARAKEIDDFFEAGMYSAWSAPLVLAGLELAINTATKKISRAVGSFVTDGLKKYDLIILGGFANESNNTIVQVTSVSEFELGFAGPSTMVDEVADADDDETITRPSYLDIGVLKQHFHMTKVYEDLTNKSVLYPGAIVDGFNINFAHGALSTVAFSFVAGHSFPDVPLTNARTVIAAGSPQPLNGSADAGKVIVEGEVAPYCIKSVGLSISNNNSEKVNLGETAAADYNEGAAQISVNMEAYLEDTNFNLLKNKNAQIPFSFFFYAKNSDGGYAISLPAIQTSMDDPSVSGGNQQLTMPLSGTAKKGPNGESALRIYKLD